MGPAFSGLVRESLGLISGPLWCDVSLHRQDGHRSFSICSTEAHKSLPGREVGSELFYGCRVQILALHLCVAQICWWMGRQCYVTLVGGWSSSACLCVCSTWRGSWKWKPHRTQAYGPDLDGWVSRRRA